MELVQETLDLPVFTINFFPGEGEDQQDQQVGSCEFGRIDHSLYRGELVSVPVNNRTDGSWTIDSVELSVNSVRVVQSLLVGQFSPKAVPFLYLPLVPSFPNPRQTSRHGRRKFHACASFHRRRILVPNPRLPPLERQRQRALLGFSL